jgi:hypothetical protein
VYRIAANLADICGLTLPARAELLLVTPKVTQAVFAALLDCYTWKLAEKAYGRGTRTAYAAVGHAQSFSREFQYLIPSNLACIVRMQPVAMVLLNSGAVQLHRNDYHNHRYLPLALALARYCSR